MLSNSKNDYLKEKIAKELFVGSNIFGLFAGLIVFFGNEAILPGTILSGYFTVIAFITGIYLLNLRGGFTGLEKNNSWQLKLSGISLCLMFILQFLNTITVLSQWLKQV